MNVVQDVSDFDESMCTYTYVYIYIYYIIYLIYIYYIYISYIIYHVLYEEGWYGLLDKMHPSCIRPVFKTCVQH